MTEMSESQIDTFILDVPTYINTISGIIGIKIGSDIIHAARKKWRESRPVMTNYFPSILDGLNPKFFNHYFRDGTVSNRSNGSYL